jgi:hypothetical protein
MKVLYLSGATGADYECDMVFHGLRSLLGPDCVDVNKIEFMYRDWPHPPFYTVYSLLPNIDVDRTDIQGKIQSRYFDLIVYGSIHRFRDHLDLVRQVYPANKIVYIDGEDDHSTISLVGEGFYFKRELMDQHHLSILPIQFCIPKEKIRPIDFSRKTRLMSPLIPGDTSTYIYYGDESKYYDQYSESYFGRTRKKGGWDCCRHYEIMAAGALPYFADLESCPAQTMNWLPKDMLLHARRLHDEWQGKGENIDEHRDISDLVRVSMERHLTTESMAKYVLDTVGVS